MRKSRLFRAINRLIAEKPVKLCRSIIAALMISTLSVFAADILITNHSFENGLTEWTQMYPSPIGGNGSITAVTEQADDGTQSLKLVDNDATKNFGMESTKIPCTAGTVYAAFARVRLVSGTADLYLRFWNGSTLLAGPAVSTVSSPVNQWQNIAAKLTAPSGATHVSVMVYSNTVNIGTAYWDKILITKEATNLGVQVYNAAPAGTTFGIGANAHKAYCVMVGTATTSPKLMVVDTNTGAVIQSITFPAGPIGGGGATTATTGDIYFGTYSTGALYRHIPGQSTITLAGTASGQSQIFDLTAGTGGRIYGGTFPSALFFSYTPTTPNTITQISTKPFAASTEYVRSLGHDGVNGVTYMSVGAGTSSSGIYRYHHALAQKVNIYPHTAMAGTVDYTGGRVFAALPGGMRVLNVTANANGSHLSTTLDATFPCKGRISPAYNGKVYYFTSGGVFQSYDIASKAVANVGGSVSSDATVTRFAWVNNKLVGIAAIHNTTYVIKYDPAISGSLTTIPVTGVIKNPGAINEIQAGPDGKIYTSAYLTGGLGVYDPMRGDSDDSEEELMHVPVTQIDRMSSYNGRLYIGAYPGAYLYEYNPAQPYLLGTNPKFLMNGAAAPYYQDRPKAVVGASTANGNYVFVGTVAQTGKMDGGVMWYNLGTQTSGIKTIANQSVISMAVYGTQLYVGTSVRPGYSSTPNTTSSKVVVYNITSTGITYLQTLNLPVSNLRSITKMLVVGAKIWGFADGHIFVLNPASKVFESCELKFPGINYGTLGTYRDADMFIVPKDPNNVYGTIAGNYLVKIPVATRTPATIIVGADKATFDSFGNLYYHSNSTNSQLWRRVMTVTSGTYTSAVAISPPPLLTSFNGCSNNTITITGNNLNGATAVSFGGTPAVSFTVDSPTNITATPAPGASGEISVTTPGGVASIPGFKFIPTPDIITDGSTTFFTGEKVILKASTGSGYSYKWNKDGSAIPEAITDIYAATDSGSYTVSIVSDSCTTTSAPVTVHVIPSVPAYNPEKNIANTSSGPIAYPNPFENALTLNLGDSQKARVEITSLDGRMVYSKQYANKPGTVSLDLSALKSEMYLLKLTLDSSEAVYKILKK